MKEQRWRVRAFPLPDTELGAAEGAGMLTENPAGLGVLLWDLARDVVLWAGTPWAETRELFAPVTERLRQAHALCAPPHPSLDYGFEHLLPVITAPRTANRAVTALACRHLSRWADDAGALSTAYAFAHAAACVQPARAEWSYHAGRLARRRADYARAEEWLTRAVLLGRQFGDWQSYGDSFATLGNVYVQRGNYPKARKYHARCLHTARRHGLRHLEGDALHNLCVVAGETGRVEEMNSYARAAYELLGTKDARLPILANDVACTWMEQGVFAPALRVFEATRPHWRSPDAVLGAANICRSAAGASERNRYEQTWSEVWTLVEGAEENAAQALLDLAQAALMMSQPDRAEKAARHSLQIATIRREGRVQIAAESVLESLAQQHTSFSQTSEPVIPDVYQDATVLAEDLAGSLELCGAF